MANITAKPYTKTDRAEFDQGFDRGNYAGAYLTERYSETTHECTGENGFFRIGHLLGFFSFHELYEINEQVKGWTHDCSVEVARYRLEFAGWLDKTHCAECDGPSDGECPPDCNLYR